MALHRQPPVQQGQTRNRFVRFPSSSPLSSTPNSACFDLLSAIPNLFVLETLDSIKKADLINRQLAALDRPAPLNVYVQINTSGEDAKAGIPPLSKSSTSSLEEEEAFKLALHIVKECPKLHILGLMTIGSFDASHAEGERNPDFVRLVETREVLVEGLKKAGVEGDKVGRKEEAWRLELSMGMSADFKEALKEGSDSVRVGTRFVPFSTCPSPPSSLAGRCPTRPLCPKSG